MRANPCPETSATSWPYPYLSPCGWLEQVRFPRSKKRRIRKKWAKRARNYAVAVPVETNAT